MIYIHCYLQVGLSFAIVRLLLFSGVWDDFNIYGVPKIIGSFLIDTLGWVFIMINGVINSIRKIEDPLLRDVVMNDCISAIKATLGIILLLIFYKLFFGA